MFWKKDELALDKGFSARDELSLGKGDLGLDKDFDMGMSQESRLLNREPSLPRQDFQRDTSQYPSQYSQPQQNYGKDLEMISAKLDALRATLENVNQRLAALERIAKESNESYSWK
jgi:hypothetical protein